MTDSTNDRLFAPATDRERVYAACVDWKNAREYFSEVESDAACVLCAAAYRLCDDGPSVAGRIVQVLLEQPASMWRERLHVVCEVTRPGAAWWRELIQECGDLPVLTQRG
jgi:hypothetical protein